MSWKDIIVLYALTTQLNTYSVQLHGHTSLSVAHISEFVDKKPALMYYIIFSNSFFRKFCLYMHYAEESMLSHIIILFPHTVVNDGLKKGERFGLLCLIVWCHTPSYQMLFYDAGTQV